MTRWPWITALLAAAAAFSPLGIDLFHGAFVSSEALSRNIARPIYLGGIAAAVAIGAFEYYVRLHMSLRRARQAGKMER